MQLQPKPSFHRTTLRTSLLSLALMASVVSGCASSSSTMPSPEVRQTQGSVRLEEVADWSFEAAHPFSIDTPSLSQILRGVMIAEAQSDLSNMPVDGSKPMRVFSDEDVQYLAPLLAQALSQAKPEYVVAFRLSSSAGSGSEPTTGILYAQNDQLYVTITSHKGSLAKIDPAFMTDGRRARLITFADESAGRIEQTPSSLSQGNAAQKSLAINYAQFTKQEPAQPVAQAPLSAPVATAPAAPAASPVVVAAAVEDYHRKRVTAGKEPAPEPVKSQAVDAQGSDEALGKAKQDLEEARQAIAKKDAKINALRRDLESMRVQLETIDKELRAVKTKQAPKREKKGIAELSIR
ncbi:MAG: hypothetical protein KF814_02365 [Nitrospiraceae bacterium]|nr:hypothetical protein [Nitrospiraceae bacterium]